MEAIAKITDRSIPVVLPATVDAFLPILSARKAQIAQTPKKTFKYGPTDRHQLDVYYPPSGTSNAPILFFVYGGGFTTGARNNIPDILYDNLGSFFAQRGILTVIADYRLAPGTFYPGPAHDISNAVKFALTSSQVSAGADKERVYVMGHSAGGAHLATMFLNEDILGAGERDVFKGVVLNGAAYESASYVDLYYGEPQTRAEIDAKTPLGLLKSKSPEKVKQLLPPRLFILLAENDAPALTDWDATFKKTLREKGCTDFQEFSLQGHNHISSNFALNSGEGEDWGEQVAKWIKA